MSHIELPSYLEQSETVRDRFARLKSRSSILQVQNLYKEFNTPQGKVTALKDINFKVHRREFVTVIGPSGCGKSTLIRTLAGLESQTSGEVLLEGKAVNGPGPDRGMVFQGYTLFPWLTVKRNVMFGLERAGRGRTGAEEDARMKQRVAIARALANQPRILLMDEPFGALDAQTRAKMQSYLLDIWKNIDITVLFITHDLDEAIYLADRILVLKAHPGEVQEVIEVPVPHPRNPEQFLSPEFLATKARLEELIHPPAEEDVGLSEDHLNMVRMVPLDDAVSEVY
jgi:NitT/TauT family transport system ATP-binding protein